MKIERMNKLALAALSLVGTGLFAQAAPTERIGTRPETGVQRRSEQVPDRFIVVFKDGFGASERDADSVMNGSGGEILHRYQHALKGFAARIPANALEGIKRNPNVDYVEPDLTVSADQTLITQTGATWGLDRINQRNMPLDRTYSYNQAGSGVTAYIIDTGILGTHQEFTGRMVAGYTAISDGRGTTDCNGHGTHVAGTVGGSTYGVAKAVKLAPVRVLDCAGSGTSSGVVAGIDWVAANAKSGSVVNMSLGGGASSAIDTAVANTVAKGITVVVAAGNDNLDACGYSPARAPSAITVGATTSTDARASYSNFGTCLDLFAPGSSITSTWYTSNTATAVLSGTSMASPHVAGVAALILSETPGLAPASVASALINASTPGLVTSPGTGSVNKLLYSFTVPPVVQDVAVQSITGSRTLGSRNWKASASVTTRNLTSGTSASGVTVSGNFNGGATQTCITSSTGSCSITSGNIDNRVGSVTFTVTNLSGSDYRYQPSQNSVTQIQIVK